MRCSVERRPYARRVLDAKDDEGVTALMKAGATLSRPDRAKIVWRGRVSVRSIRSRRGSVFRFRYRLDLHGPKPMLDPLRGDGAPRQAAEQGEADVVNFLIDAGATVDLKAWGK